MDANRGTKIGSPRGFQQILVRVSTKHPPRELAEELGISAWTFYNYRNGRSTFPADLVAPLYLATGEREIIDFVLTGTDLLAVPKPKPIEGDLVRELSRVLSLVGAELPARQLAPELTHLAGVLLAHARKE